MARTIDNLLAAIRTAVYGREVRSAIADGIEQCYDDASANTQIALIEAKGAEVLDSIPSDYSELSGRVDDLDDAVSVIESFALTWEHGEVGSTGGNQKSTSTTIIRTPNPKYSVTENSEFKYSVPSGLQLTIWANTNGTQGYVAPTNRTGSGSFSLNAGDTFRLMMTSTTTGTDVDPEEGYALTFGTATQIRDKVSVLSSNVSTLSSEVESIESSIETRFADLPAYYHENNYIEQKAATIRANMSAAGRDSFTFIFFTDPHWDYNEKQSPKLIKYILDNTGVNNVVCGGDLIQEGTHEYAVNLINDCMNSFRNLGISFPVCIGNHDRNWNPYETQRDDHTRKLTEGEVWALIEAQYDKYAPVYFGDPDYGFNFYVDYPDSNTRLIFIDTGDTKESTGTAEDHTELPAGETVKSIYWRDYELLGDALMDAGNKRIIIIAHAIQADSIATDNLGVIGTRICKIAREYNQRTNGTGAWYDYDFTNGQGRVYLVVGGHSHHDDSKVNIDPPWFMVDCDRMRETGTNPGTAGTVTEQAFDVITVNYKTGGIKFTRIGRGEDREYTTT